MNPTGLKVSQWLSVALLRALILEQDRKTAGFLLQPPLLNGQSPYHEVPTAPGLGTPRIEAKALVCLFVYNLQNGHSPVKTANSINSNVCSEKKKKKATQNEEIEFEEHSTFTLCVSFRVARDTSRVQRLFE